MSFYPFIICVCEIIFLFFLARLLTKTLSQLIHSFTGSTRGIVYGIAILFLPGTLIHELAHFFMAKILFVYAGEISLLPTMEGQMVKMGSVQIGQTDPIRKLLIGVAPLLVGTALLGGMYYFFSSYIHTLYSWQIIIPLIVTFEIANTMFSSRKDMEGTFVLFALLIFIAFMCIIFKWYPSPAQMNVLQLIIAHPFFQTMSFYLLIPLILDVILIGGLKILLR